MAGKTDYPSRRISKLRRSFKRLGVDAALVTNVPNVTYLTGFTGDDSAVLVARDEAILITDGRYTEQAEGETRGLEIFQRKKGLMEAAGKNAARLKARALGVEAQAMTLAQHKDLRKHCGRTRTVALGPVVEEQRQVKDADETKRIKRAIRVAEEAFELIRASLRPGQSEREIAARLEAAMRDLGAEAPSFPTIVAINERTSLPHAQPTDRTLRSGDAVLFDWGARVNGYCSDLTRMLFVDTITPFYARIYDQVCQAQQKALIAIKAGLTTDTIDRAARDFLKSKRRGKHFSHGLGHGIGLEIHERPSVSARAATALKPGMIFTVEPGVYLPGRGGVRIEDDVLVRKDGCDVLTSLPKSLQYATLRARA